MSPSSDRSTSSPGECADPAPVPRNNPVVLEWIGSEMIILDLVDDEDPAIDVKGYLEKSPDFHKLTEQLKTLQRRYPRKEGVPINRQINAGYKFETAKKDIARFEKKLRRLIILKDAIFFDSPLLLEVKRHIEDAAFYRANELLDAQTLTEEQTFLFTAKKDNSLDPGELDKRLRQNATCFFLKALLSELDRINGVCYDQERYLKPSIASYAFPENLFEYCIWHQKRYSGKKIEPLYLQILDSYKPETSQHAALALNNLAVIYEKRYRNDRELQKAEERFLEALAFYRNAERSNPGLFTPHIAATLVNLAIVTAGKQARPETERYEKVEEIFGKSIDQFRDCAKTDTRRYLPVLAKSLTIYAQLLWTKRDSGAAARCYDEVVAIYTTLRQSDHDRYQPLLFEALSRSLVISIQTGTLTDALEDCLEALVICRELTQNNPGTYLPHLAKTLHRLAVIHADMGYPDLAETEFREAISIYRYLRKLPYHNHSSAEDLARALNDIGAMYMNTNRPDLAKRELSRSIALYQSLTPNPFALFDMCQAMINLSVLHQKISPDKERSSELASKVVYTVRPFLKINVNIESLSHEAEEILQYWRIPESQWDVIIQDSKYVNQLKAASPHLYQ